VKYIPLFLICIGISFLLSCCFPMSKDEYMELYHNLPIENIEPAAGSVIEDSTPFFDWKDSSHVTAYHIQLSTKADFSDNIIIDEKTLTSSAYQTTRALNHLQLYYWRVRVKNEKGEWLEWSET
jgi:hypothetical protein